MAKFVSLKLTDDAGYWLVDLEGGVVSRLDKTVEAPVPDGNRFAGVDAAIVSEMRENAFSAKFDK